MSEQDPKLNEKTKMLRDPYGDWARGEGVPIVESLGVDLNRVETSTWPRFGSKGAMVHFKGRRCLRRRGP